MSCIYYTYVTLIKKNMYILILNMEIPGILGTLMSKMHHKKLGTLKTKNTIIITITLILLLQVQFHSGYSF